MRIEIIERDLTVIRREEVRRIVENLLEKMRWFLSDETIPTDVANWWFNEFYRIRNSIKDEMTDEERETVNGYLGDDDLVVAER